MKKFAIGFICGLIVPLVTIFIFHDQLFHGEHLSVIDKQIIDTVIKNETLKQNQEKLNSLPSAADITSELSTDKYDYNLLERAYSLMNVEGHENEVVSLLEDILKDNPNNEQAHSALANFKFLKHMPEAKELTLECVRKFKTNTLCNGNLTTIFFDSSEAKKYFDLCLENSPNNSICLSNRGNWYYKKYKFQEAYDTFKFLESILDSDSEGGISIDPKYIFQSIADTAKELNKKKEARDYYDKACGLGLESSCHKLEALK